MIGKFFKFVGSVLYWMWIALMAALSLLIVLVTFGVTDHLTWHWRFGITSAVALVLLVFWRKWQNGHRESAELHARFEQERAEYLKWYESLSEEEQAEEDDRRSAAAADLAARGAALQARYERERDARRAPQTSQQSAAAPSRQQSVHYMLYELTRSMEMPRAGGSGSRQIAENQARDLKAREPHKTFIVREVVGSTPGATILSL